MVSIDKQIEVARQKPLTAENLNYIGDLYLKKGDRRRAIAYFFEAVDKLHFAQKEKKIAIYKKIIKIDPYSEKACLAIVEIMSKMGLVMEEKKYLHTLAKIYEDRGDTVKSEELFDRIRELDPHVSIPGTFVQYEEFPKTEHGEEVMQSGSVLVHETGDKSAQKLIEASLEPIHEEAHMPEHAPVTSGRTFAISMKMLVPIMVLIVVAAVLIVAAPWKKRQRPETVLNLSAVINGYEIRMGKVADPALLKGVAEQDLLDRYEVYFVNVRNIDGCIPEPFASSPHNMILLLDERGSMVEPVSSAGLQGNIKKVYKTNICGRDEAVVFEKLYIAAERGHGYTGIVVKGLDNAGPMTIKGD